MSGCFLEKAIARSAFLLKGREVDFEIGKRDGSICWVCLEGNILAHIDGHFEYKEQGCGRIGLTCYPILTCS